MCFATCDVLEGVLQSCTSAFGAFSFHFALYSPFSFFLLFFLLGAINVWHTVYDQEKFSLLCQVTLKPSLVHILLFSLWLNDYKSVGFLNLIMSMCITVLAFCVISLAMLTYMNVMLTQRR